MHTHCRPDMDYPYLACEDAAEDHDVHPFFDLPSWREGFARGYDDGRLDGERLGMLGLRADLLEHLSTLAYDLRIGLRHDLETPLDVVAVLAGFVDDPPPATHREGVTL